MKNQPDSKKSSFNISPLSYEEVRMEITAMLPAPVKFDDDHNLIELGLDSLRIMRMVNKWRRRGAAVTFAELIAAPRLSDWWSLLKKDDTALSAAHAYEKVNEGHEAVNGPFPLTDVQYAYWIGRRDDQPLGGVGCHAYLEIDGRDVKSERLESAWEQLLMHHSMLRARFLADGQQEVLNEPFTKALLVHDLRLYPEDELTLELKRIRDRLSHRRLAVEQGEVAGLELSLRPGGHTRIHFDIDLLVADVQSLQIILRDLAAAYARGCRPAAPVNWSFAGYLKQEGQRRVSDQKRAAEYWRQRLATLPAAPGLPLREKPETIKTPVFKRRTYFVKEAAWTLLQKRAAACQVTPAMVLLTAYAEILDRWSTNSRFLINMPLFDRQTGEAGIKDIENIENVVADFTNLLLLTVDCSSRQSFLDRVRSIQAQFHTDVANAAYSGIQLQRDMARVRQGERDFAPVVFACNLGTPLINAECRETLGKLSFMISQTPQVWLDFQTYEMDGGLLLAWDAVDQLFPEGLIDQMFAAYTRLINWLVADNNDWQASPDIFPGLEQQRRDRDVEWSRPQSSQCLHTLFFDLAARSPQETALVDSRSHTYFSYGELSRYALRVAAFLKEKGIKEGDPVAVTLPRGIGQIAAVLGILAMGACYVPVSIGQPYARRDRIHKKAAIRYVLTDHEQAQTIEWPAATVVLNIAAAADNPPLAAPVAISPARLAYIIFTSGSTGEPKGVEISHYGAWNTIFDINRRYKVGAADRILAVSSLDFDLSVYDIFGLLSVGGSLVLIAEDARRDAAHWLNLLDKYQVTVWNSVPVLLDMLLVAAASQRQNNLPLRLAMLSGDWIGLDLPSRLKRAAEHCHLVAMGGATEASIWSNFFDVSLPLPGHWTSIPYGRPLTNQAYRVVDGKGRDCPDWVAGELWIGGAGVAQGYRGDPELTAERFVSWQGCRWYRTGDRGRYWPDGNIEFLGREDFQVKIRGHRIELGEIETALKQHPDVRDAAVIAVGDLQGNKHLAGYVVPGRENGSSLFERESAEAEKPKALWNALVNAGRAQTRQALPPEIKPEDFPVFWEYTEYLSIHYICRALGEVGAFLTPDEKYTLESLMYHCGIQPRYRALVQQWLRILADKGLLKMDETGAFSNTRTLPAELSETIKENRAYPAWEKHTRGLWRYLHQIGQYNAGLLQGHIDPLELFFSEELCLSPDDLMQTLPGTDYTNSIAGKIMETVVQNPSGAGPVRVLEIGARCGNLTKSLLSLLTPDEAIYTCTDHSAFFTNTAKNKFKNYSFVQYQVLDMDQDPQIQGYEAHSYDVIIAANSLHRARNIETTLTHMRSLLAPGGLLLLLEMTRNSRLQQISTGFLEEGFTRFEDERQEEHSPLLSVEKWQNILQSRNFAEVAIFPGQGEPANIFGQHVIVAQAPQNIQRFNPEKLFGFLRQKLPDYMVPSILLPLNELPLTANGKVNRQALPTPDNLKKANPEKVFTTPRTPVERSLAAIWSQILAIEQIDITDNFFQLGGDSLLATRLSAMVRNKLDVELSLGTIFERPTIAELAKCVQALTEQKIENSDSVAPLPQIIPVPDQWHLPFPLTDIQQAYWVGRSGVYSLGNVATHCYFEIEGVDLDIERLNRAWQRLIDHHGMLRAVVLPDGQHQKILEQVPPYRIKILDLRGKGAEAAEVGLKNIREEMSHQVLAADKWPLFDVRASRFGENRVRLHIGFDNLFLDGWSMFHLLSEWTRLYHDLDGSLPSFDLSFRDYVLALERLKESEVYQRAREYWFNRLPALPPAPELPLAQNPDSVSRQRFSRLDARLNRETWQELRKRSAEAGLTPSGILLAAYAEVLGVWSKCPRFTINLTQFNRLPLHPQVNDIIGDFTSLTLLAVDNSSGRTFLERGRNLQQQLWRDLDHSYVGGIQVQRELAKKRGEHQGTAMPVVFTSALGVDQWGGEDSGKKWPGKLVYNITQTPQVWLDHQVVEQEGELLLIWDAVAGLFPEGLLADMFAAYCNLLQRLAGEETAWRETAPSLVSVPRLEKRMEANRTDGPVSLETLTSLFEKQVACQANYPAAISYGRTLTYEELSCRSNAVGNLLREKGARPNTLVAVVMEKGWEQVVAVLGVLKSGAAYLPIDPANPDERRRQLLRDGDIRMVLTQSWLAGRLNWPEGVELLLIDQMKPGDKELTSPGFAGKPEDLAYVIYTSGSTGCPKGVMIDHRGAVNTILDVNRRFSVGPEDRVLALANLNFDLSVYDIFGILAAGATIIMPEADKTKEPFHWLELMKQEQVTVWNTVPALLQMLLEYAAGSGQTMPQSLRLVLLSGDWIPLDLPDKVKAYFPGARVIGLGGATEASIWSNLYPIREIDPDWKSIPYGRPLTNQRYYVLNELMADCPVWVPGQLYIGGIGLAKGYWHDEEKTRDKFTHHPRTGERLYCTGDLGRYWPDGNIEFLGREDFQVKISGHRIELGEIEALLKRQDGIKDAAVAVAGQSHEEKRLVGYVVLDREKGAGLFETEYAKPAVCASRWQAVRSAGQLQAPQIPHSLDIEAISAFMDYADRLSYAFIYNTLDNMGIFSDESEGYSLDGLMRRFKIHPRYQTLIFHWLNVLVEEGVLKRNEAGIYRNSRSFQEEQPDILQAGKLKLPPSAAKEALALDAFFQRDGSSYTGLLQGDIDPIELFLREDSFLTPEALSRFNLAREYYTDLAREVFGAIVNSYPADKEVRVLEIGTRAGSLTGTLVSLLPAGRGKYLYTDESSFFTDRARQKLGAGAPLEYGLFDMNKTPLRQGYEPHSFHVIVADNTLHRTRNIETTLAYLQEMLVPGGFLFFTEATRNRRLMLTTVGFFEDGFSHLEDERKTDYLLLITAEKWGDILDKTGFSRVMVFPEGGQAADAFGQHLLVAQAPEAVRVFKPANLAAAMGRKLPEYMVPATYVLLAELPLSANGKVDRKALAELGREKESLPKKAYVAPFTEAQVKVANVWKEVLGCKNVGIHDGFFELGGDSLRAIQCISLLKERYQADLTLQNLFEAPSVDLLARIIEAGVPAAAELAEHYEEGMI
ncbi:MAG TPA: non-ribosomal peptide synthetase [Methylomusa anaerophila]|uniref:Phenyloxazoline synthase MbtB n=1 Tax=Methylomusa anaerophila TaxID=1930071 RepID=A0A348AM42_9FIRM|nr:non-ribosomal peptide synthetase [Methylomusa anaerophila]BBB92140.1 phenyloxazoline synthase MbtB [Methylomusa anaerophila]HML87846.1 non-ribosomal peptide synthetase [Methylomusa anaerophila]